MRALHEVSDVLQRNIHRIEALTSNSWQSRTLYALAACRTAELGGHIDKCNNVKCNHIHISYNSCRNRHCPKCQGDKQQQWVQAREKELINVPYYHLVFTIPSELNPIALYASQKLYSLLFKTAWSVIKDFAANPKFLGAKTGMISILHTWGQNLSLHPHIHCIVPGGGITQNNKWKQTKGKGKYLFPVIAMSKVFRARFAEGLRKEFTLDDTLFRKLFSRNWVVYSKRPFYGPAQVIEYIGRYTHKIAISNHRIQSIENGNVSFTAKDYRHGGKKYLLSLTDHEFIRRFSQHILPKGFPKIRYYGILSNTSKGKIIPILQDELGKVNLPERPRVKRPICPVCKTGELVTIMTFKGGRDPPSKAQLLDLAQDILQRQKN
jgi:hypothetical protein